MKMGYRPHLANSSHNKSIFKVLTEPEFRALEDSQVQDLLRHHHIVVTGIHHDSHNFKSALELLAPLRSSTSIQGQTQPITVFISDVYSQTNLCPWAMKTASG